MHISKLSLINYRNFANAKLLFKKGTNTVIGENGSGKTNLFRAIRLLLDNNMSRSSYKLTETDFNRALKSWKGHWIIISLEFEEISADEAIQALFVHGVGKIEEHTVSKASLNLVFRPNNETRIKLAALKPGDHTDLAELVKDVSILDYETRITGKSTADFNDPMIYREMVGDFENVIFPSELNHSSIGITLSPLLNINNEISFTYIQALRDVIAEFRNNRTNPLLTLLKARSEDIDPTHLDPITEQVKELNDSIEKLPDVQAVREDIIRTIEEAAGQTYSPTSLSIKSDLSDEADKLFQSLKLYIGEGDEDYEGDIYELSLGGANLIFLTLKLLEFKYQRTKNSFANFLLIEEPEAHIHTHIQKTLFERLNYDETQIIYSTHSTHISEVCNVKNMNILGKAASQCVAYQPSNNLQPKEIVRIQRYLDAIRSNLLFAKSVILVEGDAEEILMPIIIKKILGISLDELGISLINIRSTGFENIALLFHPDRIQKRCAILTDSDVPVISVAINDDDTLSLKRFKEKCVTAEKKGIARLASLTAFAASNPWVDTFYAKHTFEVDFVSAGNEFEIKGVVPQIYTEVKVKNRALAEIDSSDIALYGRRVLTMAENAGKGWFALLVGDQVSYKTFLPDYIVNALAFAHPLIGKEIWVSVVSYRLNCFQHNSDYSSAQIIDIKNVLQAYKQGGLSLEQVFNAYSHNFPTDPLIEILDSYA